VPSLRIGGSKPLVSILLNVVQRDSFILIIKAGKMRWKRHVAPMEEMRILTEFYSKILTGRDSFKT
jgi:hypothetical protein